MCVLRTKLLSYREDFGGYIIYIFENLDFDSWKNRYVMTVRFPRWEAPLLKVGDVGFLEFKTVIAGEDTWWDKCSNSKVAYKYDNVIFLNFVHEKPETDSSVML